MIEFTLGYWVGFGALVTALLAIDLGLFHRHSRETSIREAAISTATWCCLALAFDGYVWWVAGFPSARNFLAGYLLEWSLSMDNVFVFAVIFTYFRVPLKHQYRVLFWGIIGAVVLRLVFILIGTELIDRWHWVVWVMGAFLVYTGAKLAFQEEEFDPEASLVIRVSRRLFRVSREPHGQQFFAREGGHLCITPLFLVLLVIDFVDVVALDSVPAIISITTDRFIVFTSNIFAILGLRALYFLLAGAMEMFRYLRYGLSAILVFVGVKMLIEHWVKLPDWVPLTVVVSFLAIAIGASLIAGKRDGHHQQPREKRPPESSGDESDDNDDDAANGGLAAAEAAMRDRIDSA